MAEIVDNPSRFAVQKPRQRLLLHERTPKGKDLTGKRFRTLTVLHEVERRFQTSNHREWLCRCECGREKVVRGTLLSRSHGTKCACQGFGGRHGCGERSARTPEYYTWNMMRERCNTPTAQMYPIYGGRGIKVCDRWDAFVNFLEDMGRRPSRHHSIDRIDNDGNYEPLNCRWATRKEQQRNKTNTRWLTVNGVTKAIHDWAEEYGLHHAALYKRIKNGWNPVQALTTPKGFFNQWNKRLK